MYILGDHWRDGYLDHHAHAGTCRIQVSSWTVVRPLPDIAIVRPRDPRYVVQYVREVGVKPVVDKIRSRLGESLRNRRYIAVGIGRVAMTDASRDLRQGAPVVFVAPDHPLCTERCVLDERLVRPISDDLLAPFERLGGVVLYERPHPELVDESLDAWVPTSGRPLAMDAVRLALDNALAFFEEHPDVDGRRVLPLPSPTPIREVRRRPTPHRRGQSVSGVLFGLGNYAKTQILTNIDRRIVIERVHEQDPTQLQRVSNLPWSTDTSPSPREDEVYDVYFIAGFHHTHADIAIHALSHASYAVVEKPLVTTPQQLERLVRAMAMRPGKLFVCFQMRYHPLFSSLRKDLDVKRGDPVHYHCIVYEIALPKHHWYRWPASRSHLVSNGCHWIDHFLTLNDHVPVSRRSVWVAANGDTHVDIELVNGAVMGMHLTHEGSSRIGVRDHIELRSGSRTVFLDDRTRYRAESSSRILAQRRMSRSRAYTAMYRTISRRIIAGDAGDSTRSIIGTSELMLDLDHLYWQACPARFLPESR